MKENIIVNEQGTLQSYADLSAGDSRLQLSKKFRLLKMAWVFFLFSIVGFLLETGWCYIYHGFIESRQSLVFGPFSIIYGIGAMLVILLADSMRDKSNLVVYIVGAVAGTAFEYFCSVFQEAVFGTLSWNYSGNMFSIGGRASLVFSLVWGLLAIVALRVISPLVDKLIRKLSGRLGVFLTIAVMSFMIVNMFLSATAVLRQNERKEGLEASNSYEVFLDTHFPDEKLNMIYANMRPAGGRLIRDETGHVVK